MSADTLTIKGLELKKLTDKGDVTAVFATYGSVDHDLDITERGFFGRQTVKMLWSHDRYGDWIGKGQIHEDNDQPTFEGRFFMESAAGKEKYTQVRETGDLAEWSYGFKLKAAGFTRLDPMEHGGARRKLHPTPDGAPGCKVHEVSPVMLGAGIGTHTAGIKSQSMTFGAHIQAVLSEVEDVKARALEIIELRESRGKTLGTDSRGELMRLADEAEELAKAVATLAVENEEGKDTDTDEAKAAEAIARLHARYRSLTSTYV